MSAMLCIDKYRWTYSPPKSLAALLGALSMGACAMTPDYVPPPAVSLVSGAQDFSNERPEVGDQSRPTQLRWWAVLGGSELNQLVEALAAANLDLAAAQARVDQAGALLRQASAGRLPSVSLSGETGGLKLLDPQSLPWSDTYSASISASWDTDIFGRLRKAERAARLRTDAAQLSSYAVKQAVTAELVRAYVAAYSLKRQIDIAKSLARSFEDTASLSDQRYRAGSRSVTALDVQISRQNAASSAAAVPTLEAQYVIQLQAIDILLARLPGTTVLTFDGAPEIGDLAVLPAGAPLEILSGRPDVALAEANYRAGLNDIGVARASLYPTLSLNGVVTQASNPGNVLGAETLIANLFAQAFAPLYEGGRRRAEVRRAEAASRELAVEFERAALGAVREVEAALALEEAGALSIELRAASLAAARLSDQIAGERYAAGQVGLLTVLETRRALDAARQELVAAEEARLNARIDLHLALGGEWFEEPHKEQAYEQQSQR